MDGTSLYLCHNLQGIFSESSRFFKKLIFLLHYPDFFYIIDFVMGH